MNDSLSNLIQDFHPKRWLSTFENNSLTYLFKMGFLYHGLGFSAAILLFVVQEYGFGYKVPPPEFSLGMLLLAGPLEETLFFGIPFYLTNNHYVLLVTGSAWAIIHIFNTDMVNPTFEYLAYPNVVFAFVSLFYSLRTWTSGKGWFSILFHSLWNFIVFVLVLVEGEYSWSLIYEDGLIEFEMLIFSVILVAITCGIYRMRNKLAKIKRKWILNGVVIVPTIVFMFSILQ